MIMANLVLRLIGMGVLMTGLVGVIIGITALMSNDALIVFVGFPITIISLILAGIGAGAART